LAAEATGVPLAFSASFSGDSLTVGEALLDGV